MSNKLKELGKIARNPGWLLPLLSSRAELIVAGTEPAPSMAHAAYATTELLKLLLLLILGFRSMMNKPTPAHPAS